MSRALAVGVVSSLALLRPARATTVERVVAVIGDRAILLSETRDRFRPIELQVYATVPEGASRNAALSHEFRKLVERLVDEELQGREAAKSNITVSAEEIEAALERVAKQNDLTVEQLSDEAQRNGLDATEYRQEIRRQLLDAKLINLQIQGRLRIGEDDMRSAYKRVAQEERSKLEFRAARIRIAIPPASGSEGAARQRALALQVAARARAGADFAELASTYSSDPATRNSGGLLAPMQPGELPPAMDAALLALEPGEVSAPIRVGDAWMLLKLVERAPSQLPEYAKVKPQLQARVYNEKVDAVRRQWLDGLRKRTHVDIRL